IACGGLRIFADAARALVREVFHAVAQVTYFFSGFLESLVCEFARALKRLARDAAGVFRVVGCSAAERFAAVHVDVLWLVVEKGPPALVGTARAASPCARCS